jgi:hypothetical protein
MAPTPLELWHHTSHSALKVDVFPARRRDLAAPHTACWCKRHRSIDAGVLDGLQRCAGGLTGTVVMLRRSIFGNRLLGIGGIARAIVVRPRERGHFRVRCDWFGRQAAVLAVAAPASGVHGRQNSAVA